MTLVREVRFFDARVTIAARGSRAHSLVDFALRFLDAPLLDRDVEPDLVVNDDDGRLSLTGSARSLTDDPRDVFVTVATTCDGACVETLMRAVTFVAVDRCREALTLHAAMIVHNGAGFLLPGESGSGKSTLAATLLSRGFRLATDELVGLPLSPREGDVASAQGLPRPVHLKPNSVFVLDRAIGPGFDATARIVYEGGALVHPDALGGEVETCSAAVRVVVFPKFSPTAEHCVSELSKVQVARRLMAVLVNARNLPDHGLARIANLARGVRGIDLGYSSVERAAETLLHVRRELGDAA